jgi:hypothetical protein
MTAAIIGAANLEPMPGTELDKCQVEVAVVRWREGVVDAAYGEGGRFVASQQRGVVVVGGELRSAEGHPT